MGLADRYVVAASLGRSLGCYCRSRGIDIVAAAAAHELDPNSFQDMTSYVSLARFARLLESLAQTASDQVFGIKYGLAYKLGNSGAFGFGLMNAPSFGHALKFFSQYIVLIVDYAHFCVDIGRKTGCMQWSYSPLIVAREQFADLAAILALRQLRLFAGPSWTPTAVHLERAQPESTGEHRRQMSPQMVFGAESNAIHFSAELLTLENPDADNRLFELMKQQCEERLERKKSEVALEFKIRDEILRRLSSGNISLQSIARKLGMGERSLQRRLMENGTKFDGLVNEARKELSDELLQHSHLGLADIAFQLGYSSSNAYSRAAKQWYGQAPSKIRGRRGPA
jgi:AraC-like DNA-binding protein